MHGDKFEQRGEPLEGVCMQHVLWVCDRNQSFGGKVNEYRQIEEKFVERAAHDEFLSLETRRRIVEMLLREANNLEQPIKVCRDIWNELLRLGFSNASVAATMTRYYADCCLMNEAFDEGLSVLDPMMAELQRLIDDPTATRRAYYQDELKRLRKLRDELKAGIRE